MSAVFFRLVHGVYTTLTLFILQPKGERERERESFLSPEVGVSRSRAFLTYVTHSWFTGQQHLVSQNARSLFVLVFPTISRILALQERAVYSF